MMMRFLFLALLPALLLSGACSPSPEPEEFGSPIRIETTRGEIVEGILVGAFSHQGVELDLQDTSTVSFYSINTGENRIVNVEPANIHRLTLGEQTRELHSYVPWASDPETGALLRPDYRDCAGVDDHDWRDIGPRTLGGESNDPWLRCENCHRTLWVSNRSGGGSGDDSLRLDTDPITGLSILRGTIDQDGTIVVKPAPRATPGQ